VKYGPDKHHRRSIRLRDYNYAQTGAYFVTICTQGRVCLFGEVVDGHMTLNDAGRMVQRVWDDLPMRFPSIALDMFVIMPNHVHGIIAIVGAGLALPCGGAASSAPTLGDIVRAFKSVSAIQVNQLLSRSEQPLWQRNYYEHIIRNDEELARVGQYILDNPAQWLDDQDNPQNP
jgi:REP element-mobilizing transposase RayT